MMDLQIPATPPVDFDQLYDQLDEFEPLPQGPSGTLHQEEETEEDFDGLILAGLVSPV